MNKIHREKADIKVAFSSGLNNLRCTDSVPNDLDFIAGSNLPAEPGNLAPLKAYLTYVLRPIKKIIRRAARFSYRLATPLAKPIASRIRLYLTRQILEESRIATESLKLEIQQLSILAQQNQELLKTTARRVFVPCGQAEILVNTHVGYIVCSATDTSVLASLSDLGEFETGTRMLIERFLSPSNVFIDVGAHLGVHSLAAARAIQGRGKIIAFEPVEDTKNLLEKSVWMNGFSKLIEIHQAAVSNVAEQQLLFLARASNHHSLFPLDPSEKEVKQIAVSTVRLDEFIDSKQRVDLIKIDVNGAELEVMDGCKSLIKKNPDLALIVEYNLSRIKQREQTSSQWLKTFTDLELSYKVINSETGFLENWSMKQIENTSANLFFARQDSSAWEKAGK